MKKTIKKGFTLIEILVVLVIIGIMISGFSFYNAQSTNKANKTTTVSFIQMYGTDMENSFEDYGPLKKADMVGTTAEENVEIIKTYLRKVAMDYLHTDFDLTSVVLDTPNSFYVKTVEKDAWQNPYVMFYNITEGLEGNFVIASAGQNFVFNNTGYATGNMDDDIVLSVVYRR